MAKDKAHEKAKKALDAIIDDKIAWESMLGILQARAVRDEYVTARLEKGMTQDEVAHKMGITQAAVSEFESAKYPDPHLSTIRRYFSAVGLHQTYAFRPTLESLRAELEEKRKAG